MPAYPARPQVELLSQRIGLDQGGQTRTGQISRAVGLNGPTQSLYVQAVRGATFAR